MIFLLSIVYIATIFRTYGVLSKWLERDPGTIDPEDKLLHLLFSLIWPLTIVWVGVAAVLFDQEPRGFVKR